MTLTEKGHLMTGSYVRSLVSRRGKKQRGERNSGWRRETIRKKRVKRRSCDRRPDDKRKGIRGDMKENG